MDGGAPRLDVRVLGPLAVRDGDREIVLRGPKQRLLLASLVVRAGSDVPTDRLVDGLWGTGGSDKALHALRVHVSTLRRALDGGDGGGGGGGTPLVTVHGGYRLDLPSDGLDARRFEHLVTEATELAAARRFAASIDRFDRALALWRGDAYGELAPLEPIRIEAARLDELRRGAVEDRAEVLLRAGRPSPAVRALRVHVERHRFRERAWRLLIHALYLDGQQEQALNAYAEIRNLLDEELGVEPAPELRDLQRRILRHEVPPPQRSQPRSIARAVPDLPTPFTSFVGRDDELRELRAVINGSRLVTVTGVGGVGKTRLALRAADCVRQRFPDGVGWVELAPLRDPQLVADSALASFGLPQVPDEPTAITLITRLRDRSALLVLDNCEHLLAACAELVEGLLRAAPDVTVLCTSRAALRLPGERVWRLDPLRTGGPDDAGAALRLFADRANDVDPGFALDPSTALQVAEICRRVDGIPLAIELAAVQVAVLSLDDVVDRLDDRFTLLTRGRRTADDRQSTLEGALDWSFELLEPDERALLAALSVFAGTFDLDAVEAVCREALPTPGSALDALHGLVAASLVTVVPGRARRFALLETVRDYAARRLDRPRRTALARRHRDHYVGTVRTAAARLLGRDQLVWLARLDADIDNLRTILRDAARDGDLDTGLELVGRLSRFWFLRSHLREGRHWIETFVDASPGARGEARARALIGAAAFLWEQGRDDEARGLLIEGRHLAAVHGAVTLEGWALCYLGLVDNLDGRHDRALGHAAAAIERFGDTNAAGLGFASWQRAVATYLRARDGTTDASTLRADTIARLEALLAAARPVGDRNLIGHLQWSMGMAALDGHAWRQASDWLLESLEQFEQLGLQSCATHSLDQVARARLAQGDPRSACRLLAASAAIRATLGVPGHTVERREWEAVVDAVAASLDASEFERLWAAGRALDVHAAIRLAQVSAAR